MLFPIKTVILLCIMVSVVTAGQLNEAMQAIRSKEYARGAELVAQYQDAHPDDDYAWYVEALLLLAQEQYGAGVNVISRAIKMNSEKAEYYRIQAQLYEQLEQSVNAAAAWKNCIRYTKSAALIKQAETHIRHLEQ